MNPRLSAIVDRILGPLFGLLALAVYLATLSGGAYHGVSAQLIVRTLGIMPVMTPDHPIWRAAAFVAARFAGKGAVGCLNGLSAACGAAAVWLMFEIVSRIVRRCVEEDETRKTQVQVASWLAGAAAALFMAFCVPFWLVSNRAYTASFDIMWLLLAVRFLICYAESSRFGWAVGFAAAFGLGVVEFATFIIMAPLLGGLLLMIMAGKEQLRAGHLLKLILAAVAGLLLYFIAAWQFYGSPGYALRGYSGYWHVLWIVWREQYSLILHGLPQRGWLVIVVLSVLPWLTAMAIARRALNEERDWTYYILHFIMTVIAVAVLFNFRLAPWPMLGESQLLVTPYALTASLFGYLVAYWFLLPLAWQRHDEEGWRLALRQWAGPVLSVPLAILPVVAAARNLPQTDARPAGEIARYATLVVDSMDHRPWLVSDGLLDAEIRLAAWRRNVPLRLINLGAANSSLYMRYVGQLFDSPRYRNLAQVGMMPLLSEWFASDPSVVTNVSLMAAPDLWSAAGAIPVPRRMLIVGAQRADAVKGGELMKDNERFWDEATPMLRRLAESDSDIAEIGRRLLDRVAYNANNLGVLMEDLKRPEDAFHAYTRANELDTNNLSALLNMEGMIAGGWKTDRANRIHHDLTNAVSRFQIRRSHLWALAQRYGYVRQPEAFARSGWTWALSGRPRLAFSEIQKAIDLSPDQSKDVFRQILADMYMTTDRPEQSESIYRELLAKEPANVGALAGLAAALARKGDLQEAEKVWDRAAAAGVPEVTVSLQKTLLLLAQGDREAARARLDALTKTHPKSLDAWILKSGMLAEEESDEAFEACLQKLLTLPGGRPFAASFRAERAMRRNDLDTARESFEDARRFLPKSQKILERLLRLDLLQNQMDQAAIHARLLLQLDTEHAQANFVSGHVQLLNREYDLAEDSLRRSLRKNRTPYALNDLAWLLTQTGRFVEAEKLVREALALNPGLADAYDTLGCVLMKTKRPEEAERAFERSLGISPSTPGTLIHMAELQVNRGNVARAREIVELLNERIDQLSLDEREQLNAVSRLADERRDQSR